MSHKCGDNKPCGDELKLVLALKRKIKAAEKKHFSKYTPCLFIDFVLDGTRKNGYQQTANTVDLLRELNAHVNELRLEKVKLAAALDNYNKMYTEALERFVKKYVVCPKCNGEGGAKHGRNWEDCVECVGRGCIPTVKNNPAG